MPGLGALRSGMLAVDPTDPDPNPQTVLRRRHPCQPQPGGLEFKNLAEKSIGREEGQKEQNVERGWGMEGWCTKNT